MILIMIMINSGNIIVAFSSALKALRMERKKL